MSALATWLCEQVEQDRRAVAALTTRSWGDEFEIVHRPVQRLILESRAPDEVALEVLARCEAYERVLTRHRHPTPQDESGSWMRPESCLGCGWSGDPDIEVTYDLDECPELRDMAVAYQHRPGYREEWRP